MSAETLRLSVRDGFEFMFSNINSAVRNVARLKLIDSPLGKLAQESDAIIAFVKPADRSTMRACWTDIDLNLRSDFERYLASRKTASAIGYVGKYHRNRSTLTSEIPAGQVDSPTGRLTRLHGVKTNRIKLKAR